MAARLPALTAYTPAQLAAARHIALVAARWLRAGDAGVSVREARQDLWGQAAGSRPAGEVACPRVYLRRAVWNAACNLRRRAKRRARWEGWTSADTLLWLADPIDAAARLEARQSLDVLAARLAPGAWALLRHVACYDSIDASYAPYVAATGVAWSRRTYYLRVRAARTRARALVEGGPGC